jgi:uncharacterized protein YbdZ (MbtH family)
VAADVTGCSTTTWANVFVAGSDRVGGSSEWFSICIKAERAAAWTAVSAAWTEIKPAPRRMHKPKAILIFMELSIFIPVCEHPQGQKSLFQEQIRRSCLSVSRRSGDFHAKMLSRICLFVLGFASDLKTRRSQFTKKGDKHEIRKKY